MRILALADYHLGVKTYGKIDPKSNLNTREIKALEVLDEVIDYAINNEVDMIVSAGDMYKNNLPTPTLQDEFNVRIKRASDANIVVLLLDGNHDVSKLETSVSAVKTFDTLKVNNVFHTRCHKEYIFSDPDQNRFKFVCLPTYHTANEIKSIIDNTTYENNMPIIFIGHMTIRGAHLNDWLIEDKEVYVDTDVFDKEGVCAVILGHLHKHQILKANPLIFYTGSTQRVDFNEEKQPKGFVILDIDQNGNVEYEFKEVNTQKFFTAKFNFQEEKDATDLIKKYFKDNKESIYNSIIRIQIELDELTKIDDKEVYNFIYSLGADTVLNIQKSLIHDKQVRDIQYTEHMSIEKGLELYYKDKVRGKERIELGKEIFRNIEEENNSE